MQLAHDYFTTPELIPLEVVEILSTFEESGNGYEVLTQLNDKLLQIGWCFDFGLDAEPFNLMPKAEFDKLKFNDVANIFYFD